ncbi:Atu4866 domain-containing protein [Streptomyces sp. NPDC048361]|uniref:Atu4866 domain-containing protein n=1 Tax=Streptomyces sp. NPDC048361 TaxID=3154720 RepID=UPI003436EDBB
MSRATGDHHVDHVDHVDVIGMWVTKDGHVRQELRSDGRYDEARGGRSSAYTGRYTVTGSHLDYVDDTGFTATGDVRGGVLFHEHLVLYREPGAP